MKDNNKPAVDPQYDRFITRKEWLAALGITKNTFKKRIREGKIPQPLPFGERMHRWPYTDLQDVLARRFPKTLAQ